MMVDASLYVVNLVNHIQTMPPQRITCKAFEANQNNKTRRIIKVLIFDEVVQ